MQILPFWPTAASGENRTENFSLSGHQITVPGPFSLLTYTGRGDPTCPQPDLSALGNTPVTGQADHGAIIGITHQLLVHVHYGLCLYNFRFPNPEQFQMPYIFFPFPAQMRAVL